MKTIKKLICIILCVFMLLGAYAPVFAEDAGISSFSFKASTEKKSKDDTITWYYNSIERKYYLFVPANTDLGNLTVYFTASDNVFVDGKEIENGATTDVFSSTPYRGQKEYTLTCGNKSYSLTVMQSVSAGAMFITTESGSMDAIHADKEHKESGTLTFVRADGTVDYNGKLKSIKGRGNHSWTFDKKPYTVKLDKKAALLGMDNAKGWTLITNHFDQSLLKNHVFYDWAKMLNMPSTPDTAYIDLFLNGEYYGCYMLTDKTEVGAGRVDINDLEKANEDANPDVEDIEALPPAGSRGENCGKDKGSIRYIEIPNEPEDITGGYLLEVDTAVRYEPELCGFVSNYGTCVVSQSPEYASKGEMEYISGYYQEYEDALMSLDGYNSLGKHYTDYIDLDSFAWMYLMQEFTGNTDAGLSSFFMYKDSGGKLVAGPIWDLDQTLKKTTGFIAAHCYYDELINPLAQLYNHDDFRNYIAELWYNEMADTIGSFKEYVKAESVAIEPSAVMDAIRWNKYETADVMAIKQTFESNTDFLLNYTDARRDFFNKAFIRNGFGVHYFPNGANGIVLDPTNYTSDSIATVKEYGFSKGGRTFYGWNTMADGSGVMYQPGQKITVNGTTALYAQWTEPAPTEPQQPPTEPEQHEEQTNIFSRLLDMLRSFFRKLFSWLRPC